tara:strand:+ start:45 stop:284 length:240 start_codon:yes stop_codon:yes gene_type:complete
MYTIEKPNEWDKLSKYVSLLPPREKAIITKRYGLDGGIPQTLQRTSVPFGVTAERIRQIVAKSLRRMRGYYYKELRGEL